MTFKVMTCSATSARRGGLRTGAGGGIGGAAGVVTRGADCGGAGVFYTRGGLRWWRWRGGVRMRRGRRYFHHGPVLVLRVYGAPLVQLALLRLGVVDGEQGIILRRLVAEHIVLRAGAPVRLGR